VRKYPHELTGQYETESIFDIMQRQTSSRVEKSENMDKTYHKHYRALTPSTAAERKAEN